MYFDTFQLRVARSLGTRVAMQCKRTSHVIFYFWSREMGGGCKERERESLLMGNTYFIILVLDGVFFFHITRKSDVFEHVQINV